MKVAFRVDASLQMGTGHVMRCLTLAGELKQRGHQLLFICRQHKGHLNALIRQRGFEVYELPLVEESIPDSELAHANWLGCGWQQDAEQVSSVLASFQPDWLVVDHYALDQRWETAVYKGSMRLMVIDDLADRPHRCDLLLDQTFGVDPARYGALVPAACTLLLGTEYALLRPEFSAHREASLQHREQPKLERLLITLGGVDADNVTGKILQQLQEINIPGLESITVVMGPTAPWLEQVRKQAEEMRYSTEVLSNVSNMAELMAQADLAIGAAGSTSWERCCLGLPTLMLVLADNQKQAAQLLAQAGCAIAVSHSRLSEQLVRVLGKLRNKPSLLHDLAQASLVVTDGGGTQVVAVYLESLSK